MHVTTPALALGLSILIGGMGIPGAGALGAPSLAAEDDGIQNDLRTLTVSGKGKVSTSPEVADVLLGVLTPAESARDALTLNNRSMAGLTSLLQQRGIAEEDIQTTNVRLSPRNSQSEGLFPAPDPSREENTSRIVGYDALSTVRVTIRELGSLGELLDAVAGVGANQMNGIDFRIEHTASMVDEARTKAVADARRKAEMLCKELGMALADPIEVVESDDGSTPQPPASRALAAAEEGVPVASPGKLEVEVKVRIVYEMTKPD